MCQNDPTLKSVRDALVHPDSQDSAVCDWLLFSEHFRNKILEKGYFKEAYVIAVIGGGYYAFEGDGAHSCCATSVPSPPLPLTAMTIVLCQV